MRKNIDKLAATGLPLFITEFDIPDANDANQLNIMKDRFTLFWNHPKILGITYWGYVVGSTWKSGTGLLNTNGTERPALTWLKDFVKSDLNPPNDFPNILHLSTGVVGIVPQGAPLASTAPASIMSNGPGFLKIFDLQGRVTGTAFGNNRALPIWPAMLSKGSYVTKRDGLNATNVTKVR